ncbi:MAG: DUF3014 domain-containing protein [Acidiferrobacterales bacterium]
MKYKLLLVVVLLVGAGAGFYYWQTQQQDELPAPPPAPPAAPPAKPRIRYPVLEPPAETEKPLPSLDQSDPAMLDALSGFFGQKSIKALFIDEDLVHRFVVAVDGLTRSKLPMRYRLFKPVAGQFLASGTDENLVVSPDNDRRYTPYVLLAEAVDSKTLVATYVRFYPLFQQEYKSLGYPKGYFNDRVVEVIDDMLATPDVKEPVRLIRPNVLYQFADPDLEALSAGQKILLRMGPKNEARIKAKLGEIRRELTGQMPER